MAEAPNIPDEIETRASALVMPAKAGIQTNCASCALTAMDPSLRWGDSDGRVV
jgi:hypothetical protein